MTKEEFFKRELNNALTVLTDTTGKYTRSLTDLAWRFLHEHFGSTVVPFPAPPRPSTEVSV